jgi:hypothetical protein
LRYSAGISSPGLSSNFSIHIPSLLIFALTLRSAEVSEIDQNGNECSINLFTLERTIDYVNENLTVVSIGGELVPALRLI